MKISSAQLLTLLLIIAAAIEAVSLLEWAAYPFFPDKALLFARSDATVFEVLAPLSPGLLLLLLYSWPVRLVMLDQRFSKLLKTYFSVLEKSLSRMRSKVPLSLDIRLTILDHPRWLLAVAMAAAALFGIVPYRPDLNPTLTPVGVDAHFYIEWVNQMLQKPPTAALFSAMGSVSQGSRPLLLIPIYLAVSTGWITTVGAVEILPIILGPILAMSTFLFVREGKQDEGIAGLAALFSVFSFATTVGMWAGFYANWLALAETYLFLGMLLSFSRSSSNSKLLVLMLLSVSILLTHPWTWIIALTLTSIFAAFSWKDTHVSKIVKPLAFLVTVNIILDVVKSEIFGGLAAAQDASASLNQSGLSQSFGLWQNITGGLFFAYDGLLGNAVFLGLSALAVFYLRFENRFDRLLLIWVALGSLPFPLLSSLIQTRIVYDLPIPVLVSIGILLASPKIGTKMVHHNLFLMLVLLLSANYVLRALTSLVAPPF